MSTDCHSHRKQEVTGKYDPLFFFHSSLIWKLPPLKPEMLLDVTYTGILIVPRLGRAVKRLSTLFNLRGQENPIVKLN